MAAAEVVATTDQADAGLGVEWARFAGDHTTQSAVAAQARAEVR